MSKIVKNVKEAEAEKNIILKSKVTASAHSFFYCVRKYAVFCFGFLYLSLFSSLLLLLPRKSKTEHC